MAEFNEVKTSDMNEPWEGTGVVPGVKVTMLAFAGAALAVAIPYAVTPLLPEDSEAREAVGEYRVWLTDDPIPFSHMFRTSPPKTEELAAEVIGDNATIAALGEVGADGEPDVPEAPSLVVEPEPPELRGTDPGVRPVGPDAQGSDARSPEPDAAVDPPLPPSERAPPLARIKIPESSYSGLEVFIEDPHGVMRHFYRKLARVALKEEGAVARISHFGDSAIAADGMPSATRRLLQRTFGDGGHGFSLVAASNNWYRRKDINWSTRGFRTELFISRQSPDGRYGYGGTAAIGYLGARARWETVEGPEGTVGTRASRIRVPYLAQKGGGRFVIRVDGEDQLEVDTESPEKEDRTAEVGIDDGPHTIEIKNVGGGATKLYGAIIERTEGVVVDGLGTIGARDTRWLNVDKDHMAWSFAARDPDLAVFMYGGNQLEDKVSMERYERSLTEVVGRWKEALGERTCLVMSAMDHGERYRGRVRTVKRLVDIMAVQERVALAEGCAWFSLYEAMGGDGSIGKWHEAGLAEGDLAHPTAKGAVVLGQLFYKALMKGFSDYVAAETATP